MPEDVAEEALRLASESMADVFEALNRVTEYYWDRYVPVLVSSVLGPLPKRLAWKSRKQCSFYVNVFTFISVDATHQRRRNCFADGTASTVLGGQEHSGEPSIRKKHKTFVVRD